MDLNTEYQSETVLRNFSFTVIIRDNERKPHGGCEVKRNLKQLLED